MKKFISMFLIIIILLSLCSCSKQDLADMTTLNNNDYAVITWGNKTYVPYGALSAYGDRGKQIGIVDGNKNDKVYECKGYSTDEWIVTAFPYDAAMLWREINVANIPEGWQSEYDWNNKTP